MTRHLSSYPALSPSIPCSACLHVTAECVCDKYSGRDSEWFRFMWLCMCLLWRTLCCIETEPRSYRQWVVGCVRRWINEFFKSCLVFWEVMHANAGQDNTEFPYNLIKSVSLVHSSFSFDIYNYQIWCWCSSKLINSKLVIRQEKPFAVRLPVSIGVRGIEGT